MSTERKLVSVLKRYIADYEGQPLLPDMDNVFLDIAVNPDNYALLTIEGVSLTASKNVVVAWQNLQVCLEACAKSGLEELADAVMTQSLIDTREKRDLIFSFHPDPLAFFNSCEDTVEQHKEYLK